MDHPNRIIVTHRSPDLDAIGAVWLLKRFLSAEYADAAVLFVPAGQVLTAEVAAQFAVPLTKVTHVDTGMGEYDHHQPSRGGKRICASSLVYDLICKIQKDKLYDRALRYLVEYITAIDHFEEASWPDADDPRYQLMAHGIIAGAKNSGQYDDDALLRFGCELLDATYAALRSDVRADEVIQTKGTTMKIGRWKVLAIATSNGEVEKRAQKVGYDLAIRKDEGFGSVRIKATPESGIDLTGVYEEILKKDAVGTWFLHNSHRMLLNGSSKNETQIPSPLSLTQIVEIVKEKLS
jgi:hypothetical protein